MMLTKIGAALGTLAFVSIVAAGVHQKIEVDAYNASAKAVSVTEIQKSTVEVITSDGLCSGWVLKGSNRVVTAAHCFEGNQDKENALILFRDGTNAKFKVEKMGEADGPLLQDLATLVPVETTGKLPEGLPICTFKPYVGEPVAAFGNPLGVDWTVTYGHVSNPSFSSYVRQDLVNAEGTIVIDASVYPGNSGGALVDMDQGCVQGSVEAIILADPQTSSGGVSIAVPVK